MKSGTPPPLSWQGFYISPSCGKWICRDYRSLFSRWKLERFSLNLKSTIRKLLNCIFKVKVQIWSTPKRCEVAFVERSSVLTWREERFKAPLPPLSFCWWHQSFFLNKLYCVCVSVCVWSQGYLMRTHSPDLPPSALLGLLAVNCDPYSLCVGGMRRCLIN